MAINKETVRVFDNPLMDLLSKSHPAFPAAFWIPIAAVEIWYGSKVGIGTGGLIGLAIGGFFTWTLFEYILHRWVFHFVPTNPWLRKQYYLVHQIHHDYHEWYRLVAPPLMSVTLGLTFYVIFRLTLGPVVMWPFFGGFTLGYLAYDYVHFYTHFAKPTSKLGKYLRRNHLHHHGKWHNKWYGVASPLWDFVFRTHVREGDVPVGEKYNSGVDWGRPGVAKS